MEIWIDAQILDGDDWRAAAKKAGLSLRRARVMFGHPRVLAEMGRRALLLREGEAARTLVVLAAIRDRGLSPTASAAQQKASIEAARLLQGGDAHGTTINVAGNAQIAGYVIKLDGPAEGPRAIGKAITIEHEGSGE